MKRILALVLVSFIGCIYPSSGQFLRPEVEEVVSNFDEYLWLDLGLNHNNPQKIYFDRLKSIATNEELVLLTDNGSEVTKCYAFNVLVERNSTDLMPIVLKHLYDKGYVNTWYGCLKSWERVSDYFLQEITSKPNTPSSFTLNEKQQSQIDSILIFDKKITAVVSRSNVLIKLKPERKYYNRVREIAIEDSINSGVVPLSKFNNPQDKQFIISKLASKNENDKYYGLWAVRNYPDNTFFPFIKAIHKRETESGQSCFIIRMLYQAIVQYRNQESKDLFDLTFNTIKLNTALSLPKCGGCRSECHSKFMWLAIEKYPNDIYKSYQEKLVLTQWQKNDMNYWLDRTTDENLPFTR